MLINSFNNCFVVFVILPRASVFAAIDFYYSNELDVLMNRGGKEEGSRGEGEEGLWRRRCIIIRCATKNFI